jgi:hypothetical protein
LDSQSSLLAEMIDEAARYFAGEPLQHQVSQDQLAIMA